ncbi:LysR substrate-binding domain-containing protein [Oricola sp.]|uniref:LysR substrate-binding domain-containing protein n=1 Tax=Oricola sp. TaxID=1979950 RepID=UPI0025D75F5A|nr:LysR substrate-binding domain-containing protein [Oricola sp.]MCI5076711.1 LysR substrate-binding domain-containing protein [Oricola sp.]
MNSFERNAPGADLLRAFLAISETGNLTRAAETLGRTQSATSVQLRRLEEMLRVRLFERRARGMALTADGERLLPAARRVLSELERIGTLFDAPLAGRIRVGIPDDFDDAVLERALADFAARNPMVEVVAASGCTSRYPERIGRGELDVAVCSGPERTSGTPLAAEPVVWTCAEAAVMDRDAPVPLALLDRDCWWRDMPVEALDRAGRAWRIAYRSSGFASLRAAIRAGLAVGPLPRASVGPGLRVLGEADGMPPLPFAQREIMVARQAPPALVSAMTQALRRAVTSSGGQPA